MRRLPIHVLVVIGLGLAGLSAACGEETEDGVDTEADFVFTVEFSPAFGGSSRLMVERSGGRTSVTVTAPTKLALFDVEPASRTHIVDADAAETLLAALRGAAALPQSEPVYGDDGVDVVVSLSVDGGALVSSGTAFWCPTYRGQPREWWIVMAICEFIDTIELGEGHAHYFEVLRNANFEFDRNRATWEAFKAARGL
jgi:hypothetical protein